MLSFFSFFFEVYEFSSFSISSFLRIWRVNCPLVPFLDLKNSKIQVDKLNYYKESGENSEIDFDINFVLDKYYNIKELIFSEADSKIFLSNIKLNKNFEVKDFKKLKFKTFRKKNKNNDFVIEKSDKISFFENQLQKSKPWIN